MMTIAQIMEKMIAFSEGNIHDITHLSCVWTYAKTIGELEGLDADTQFILEVAAIDYQILIEADYIVNASESGYGRQAIRTFMEHTMKTAAGIRLTKTVFGV